MVRRVVWLMLVLALSVPMAAEAARHRVGVAEPADESRWGFNPTTVTIAVGDSVDFVNDGKIIHSFVADDNSFNSNVIQPGGTFAVTFTRSGRVPYLCDIHPQMVGVIDVRAAAAPAAGEVMFPETGFSVSDADGVLFLSEFRRLGGVQAVG